MKILIAYVSAGTGHRRAAEAVYSYFKENLPACDLRIIDALRETNPVFRRLYSYGYLFLINHALWLWYICFWITSFKSIRPLTAILNSFLTRLNAKGFFNLLTEEKPDFIISTHFFPSEAAAQLKNAGKINSRLISVITDFGVHPFWVLEGTDTYVVASDFTKRQLILAGVREDSIKVLGIPVDSKFLQKYDEGALCAKLGIDPGKFTLLVSTGSSSIGQVEKIANSLHKESQILVVCAHNKKLRRRLIKRNYPGVKIFGFVDNMQELMAVSDMIITKPGGLTISESLAMGLVPLFITAIPGQETENAKILSAYSIGMNIKDAGSIKDAVLDFIRHPDKMAKMKERINLVKKPFAVMELCDVIRQGSAGAAR